MQAGKEEAALEAWNGLGSLEELRARLLRVEGESNARTRAREEIVGRETTMSVLSGLGQDIRLAGRSLSRSPGFTTVALLTLALGIGANVTLFGVVSAVFLAPLPVADPDRVVMVYTSDDPIIAKELEEIGCVAVMPLASLIGSGMGILNPWNLQIIIENAKAPVIVDAGVGTASDATVAMELGCDGVLMNTAVAAAKNPVLMATAMKGAVEAGRAAFLAGRMPKKLYSGSPSSPTTGVIAPSRPK